MDDKQQKALESNFRAAGGSLRSSARKPAIKRPNRRHRPRRPTFGKVGEESRRRRETGGKPGQPQFREEFGKVGQSDAIPNTVVKPLSPDGTARATAWETRTPPD